MWISVDDSTSQGAQAEVRHCCWLQGLLHLLTDSNQTRFFQGLRSRRGVFAGLGRHLRTSSWTQSANWDACLDARLRLRCRPAVRILDLEQI